MGEKAGFVTFTFNDVADVETFNAGLPGLVEKSAHAFQQAVEKLKSAVIAGDLPAVGVAQGEIAQVAEQLADLSKAKAQANEYLASTQPQVTE